MKPTVPHPIDAELKAATWLMRQYGGDFSEETYPLIRNARKMKEKLSDIATLFGLAAETKKDIPFKYAQELRAEILGVLDEVKI